MIYPFGIILCGIIIYILFKNTSIKKVFISCLTLELLFAVNRMNYGYFIKIGGMEIDYNDILLGVLVLISSVLIFRNPVLEKKLFFASFFLVSVILISLMMCIINPADEYVINFDGNWDNYFRGLSNMTKVSFSGQSILMYIRVIIFLIIANAAKSNLNIKEWIDIGINILKYSKIFLIYGILEIIMKYGLGTNTNIYLSNIFGHGAATGNDVSRLQGLCREPSYYALGIFNYVLLSILIGRIAHKVEIKNYIWTIVATALGCISGSFSFFVCTIAIFLFLYNMNNSKKKTIYRGLLFLVVPTLLVSAFSLRDNIIHFFLSSPINTLQRLGQSIKAIKDGIEGTYIIGTYTSSETARLTGTIISVKSALLRPFLGLGIGTVSCLAGIPAIFCNIGFLGLFAWVYQFFYTYASKIKIQYIFILLLPKLVCDDLYTLYDTSYLIIIPLVCFYTNYKRRLNDEANSFYMSKH